MTVKQLREVRDAAATTAGAPGVHVYDDFIIYNGACRWGITKLVLRGLGGKLLRR